MSARSATAPQPVVTPTTNARPQRTRRLTLLSSSRVGGLLPPTGWIGSLGEERGAEGMSAQLNREKTNHHSTRSSSEINGQFDCFGNSPRGARQSGSRCRLNGLPTRLQSKPARVRTNLRAGNAMRMMPTRTQSGEGVGATMVLRMSRTRSRTRQTPPKAR